MYRAKKKEKKKKKKKKKKVKKKKKKKKKKTKKEKGTLAKTASGEKEIHLSGRDDQPNESCMGLIRD